MKNEVYDLLVEESDEGIRLDKYLSDMIPNYSRSYIQKYIEKGSVTVNQKKEKAKYLVREGDRIHLELFQPKVLQAYAEAMQLDIIYEDEDVIVVNKPAGMVVHPAPGNTNQTLVNGLLYQTKGKLSSINGTIRPGIVHRIDKDTSGLLMIAKNNAAHLALSAQLKEHSVYRRYVMLSYGKVKERITINQPIGRNPRDRLKMGIVSDGKPAITHVKPLKVNREYSYAEAQLETGRTHQIRIHMTSIGHPLIGDPLYHFKKPKFAMTGQMLHAKSLGFIHPKTKTYLEFTVDPPVAFRDIQEKIGLL